MNLQNTSKFLISLQHNNNREWFKANEKLYQTAKKEFETLIELLILGIKEFDTEISNISAKDCVFRIFRDVRFSHNKEPYKANFGAFIAPNGRKSEYAGYYVHFEPGNSFLGGGIYMPQPDVLRAIRNAIYDDSKHYKDIINNPKFKKYFSEIYGEKLKTAPKGFPKDFPDIDLLKPKHYALSHPISDSFWQTDKILVNALDIFKTQFTFNRFLNYIIKDMKHN
jgi:uncharacterized protein (TIGR02453 family)